MLDVRATVRGGLIAIIWLGVLPAMASAEIGDGLADVALGQSSLTDAVASPIGAASFAKPRGMAIDTSVHPNRAYVSDSVYHRVLGWSDVDAMANGAPADLLIGQPTFDAWGCNGQPWDTGNTPPATLASLCEPTGLAVDAGGNLFVADSRNCRVLAFADPFGTDQVADLVLGQSGVCDGVTVNANKLFFPQGVDLDSAGNAFVADTLNCRVLEYDQPLATHDTTADRVYGQAGFTTNTCSASGLYFPVGVDIDADGDLHVGSYTTVATFTDALSSTTVDHRLGTNTCNDGGESASTTCGAQASVSDAAGRLYLLDTGNSRVLRFDDPLNVSQAARVYGQPAFTGSTTLTHDACNTGGASANSLCLRRVTPLPLGSTYEEAGALALDSSGRLYVADGLNHRVVRYDTPLTSSTATRVLGHATMSDTRKPVVPVHEPSVAVANWNSVAVVVEETNSRILLYPNLGRTDGLPAAVIGQPNLHTTGCNSGGVSATSLCGPTAAMIDPDGNLWVADTGNNRVLQYPHPTLAYDSNTQQYVASTTAVRVFGQNDFSTAACGSGAGGLCGPRGVAVDARQSLYVADSGNHRVVHHENPLADAVAERIYGGPSCNAGGLSATSLCDPRGLAIDAAGNLIIADRGNHRVVIYDDVFTQSGGADHVIGQPNATTAACGSGTTGLCHPTGVALDAALHLLVADTDNSRVVGFDDPRTDGVADRVLGQPDFTTTACRATAADSLCHPSGVAYDTRRPAVLVADAGNQRVVEYDAPYCTRDFVLGGPSHPFVRGRSGPQRTALKIKWNGLPGTPGDLLEFKDKLVLLENDGGIEPFNTALLTLSSSAGIAYQERVPSLSNQRVTPSGGKWIAPYLKGERDHGIDVYELTTKFVIPAGAAPQFNRVGYKGRAVGLSLASFTASQATYRAQFGSLCFTTNLSCRTTGTGRSCKVAR